jgi:hypothetical protein
MSTWRVTDADRDADGNIMLEAEKRAAARAAEADGAVAEVTAAVAAEAPRPVRAISPSTRTGGAALQRQRVATLCLAALLAALILIALISLARPAPIPLPAGAPPRPAPTAADPSAPTAEMPAITPLPLSADRHGASIPAFFDYRNAETVLAIDPRQGYAIIGRAGESWVRVRLRGDGEVWVRRQDLPLDAEDAAALSSAPDLAPPTRAPTAPPLSAPVVLPAPAAPASPAGLPAGEAGLPAPTVCVRSDYGVDCGVGLDPEQVVVEQATRSKAYSDAWLATATAAAR